MNKINVLATENRAKPPFQNVRVLPPDNGERFMSAYISILNEIEQQYKTLQAEESLRCPCSKCYRNPIPLLHIESSSVSSQQQQQQQQQEQPQQQQKKKKKRRKKRKASTASLTQILPTVQITPSPQLIYLQQQQQMYYNTNLMQLLPQNMYYNLLPPLPAVATTPPVQYTNGYCCKNMWSTDDYKRKEGHHIQRTANDVV